METVNITGNIVHETADPISIELARGQRGGYGWTIKVRGKHPQRIVDQIHNLDAVLRSRYVQPEEGE